jgi:tetratricopeptide (TPR) repeat protein
MDQLAQRGDFQNAIDILEYCTELHPESDQAYAFLAKAHFDQGNYKSGKRYLEKALDLNPKNRFAQRIKMMIESR